MTDRPSYLGEEGSRAAAAAPRPPARRQASSADRGRPPGEDPIPPRRIPAVDLIQAGNMIPLAMTMPSDK